MQFLGIIPVKFTIANKLTSTSDIKSLANNIIQKKVNLNITYDNFTYVNDPNKSIFAAKIISYRLNESNLLGDKSVSIGLLEYALKMGANPNITQHDGGKYAGNDFFTGNTTLVTMAADACSLDAIKLLQKYGADLSLKSFYWTRALNSSVQVENSAPCIETANYLARYNKENTFYSLWSFLFPRQTNNSFVHGNDLDISVDDELRDNLKEKLDITLSIKPTSPEPSDAWYSEFEKRLAKPYGQDMDDTAKWWNSLGEGDKAWACYYSTFDEARSGLNRVGYSDDDMTKTDIGGPFIFKWYSNFLVHTFSDYCNSIK